MFTVRKARIDDAKALAEVAAATFKATFGAVNDRANMELHCRTNYGEEIQAAEIANPGMVTLLDEADGAIAGYAQLRWGNAPACVGAAHPGEIQRLYVVDAWHGKGVAQQLMDACMEELARHGTDVAWLGVWERNPRAIAFYRKSGFATVGDHVFPLGDDPQRDLVMVRPIIAERHI